MILRSPFVQASLLGMLFMTSVARGADNETEVIAGVGAYQIQSGYASRLTVSGGETTLGVGRTVLPFLEIGLRTSLNTYSSTNYLPGGTQLFATLGPTFNIEIDDKGLANAFFLALGLGINLNHIEAFQPSGSLYNTTAESTLGMAYLVELGKRFALLANVAWMPTISMSGYKGTDIFNNDTTPLPIYALIPLRFSVHF